MTGIGKKCYPFSMLNRLFPSSLEPVPNRSSAVWNSLLPATPPSQGVVEHPSLDPLERATLALERIASALEVLASPGATRSSYSGPDASGVLYTDDLRDLKRETERAEWKGRTLGEDEAVPGPLDPSGHEWINSRGPDHPERA